MNLKQYFPVHDKAEIKANLKRNWYFPISAMAFFCLTLDNSLGYCIGLPIVFAIAILAAGQISSVANIIKQSTTAEKILCLLSAAGICLGNQAHLYNETVKLIQKLSLPNLFDKLFLAASYVGAICALLFVFFCVLIFWKKMKQILCGTGLTADTHRTEWVIYSLLLTATIGIMVFAFVQSQAFYGTNLSYDIIYTSDSAVSRGNVYLALTHHENDLRQPLFAVFAAPFTGIPYLISRLIGASASLQAILLNSVQILILFISNFMLAKMLKLDVRKRICFMVLSSCTYTHLLFSLMMEQYIIAYFWLIFCMYIITEKQRLDRLALWGAGGTLLTGMVLLPFTSVKSPIKEFKSWLTDMIKHGLEFVVLLLVFCRFDVIFNLVSQVSYLSGFTGKAVTFTEKIYQYTDFLGNCFLAPNAGVNPTRFDHVSWQLDAVTGIHILGVVLLVLAVISAIWNRNKKSSLLAACWVGFSLVMLLGLGWGTKENGLILYALYFGWAFLVLLFQLVEKIEQKLNIKFLIPIFTICAAVALLVTNLPAIMELVEFAITYYPV